MRDVAIGQGVRVRRWATLRRRGERSTQTANGTTGIVRQVWRGDRQALIELDRDGLRYSVRLRDLRAIKVAPRT